MRRSRRGEWRFVAGLVVSAGLFAAAEPLNAEGGDTAVTMRKAVDADAQWGEFASAHVDYVHGMSGTAKRGDYRFNLTGAGHEPKVGEQWGVTVVASDDGQPFEGTASIDVMMNSAVVRRVGTQRLRHGAYTRAWAWPAQATGAEFTIRITIRNAAISQTFLYPLKVIGRN